MRAWIEASLLAAEVWSLIRDVVVVMDGKETHTKMLLRFWVENNFLRAECRIVSTFDY